MKYLLIFIVSIMTANAVAADSPVEIPFNQHLSAVDYFRDSRQSGCGLRATAETKASVWLNILVTVFLKPSGITLGVTKVVARKANIRSSTPESPEQNITFSSIGKIQQAWITAKSDKQSTTYKSGKASHGDGYMLPMEFAQTTQLLAAMSRENFQVGISLDEEQPDMVFEFDQRPHQTEINELSACMNKLRNEIAINQRHQMF